MKERHVNRRVQPLHRRKRKLETTPSTDDGDSVAGTEDKRLKMEDDPEGCMELAFSPYDLLSFPPSSFPHADDIETPPPGELVTGETVEIQIRPHPDHANLNEMAIKNLATSPLCTISHILRFIKLNNIIESAPPPEAGREIAV